MRDDPSYELFHCVEKAYAEHRIALAIPVTRVGEISARVPRESNSHSRSSSARTSDQGFAAPGSLSCSARRLRSSARCSAVTGRAVGSSTKLSQSNSISSMRSAGVSSRIRSAERMLMSEISPSGRDSASFRLSGATQRIGVQRQATALTVPDPADTVCRQAATKVDTEPTCCWSAATPLLDGYSRQPALWDHS
jgi:hypothetical protein